MITETFINGTFNLAINCFLPESQAKKVLIFYSGGAFLDDNRSNFYTFAKDMVSRDIAVYLPQYRVYRIHNTFPNICISDTVAGLKAVKDIIDKHNIGSDSIIWGGGSAGAQLVLCAALMKEYSPGYKPEKLILFNPVCCPHTLNKYIYSEINTTFDFTNLCPLHDSIEATCPILIMHGTDDEIAPFQDTILFSDKYRRQGGDIELIPYNDRKHGFHHPNVSHEDYLSTFNYSVDYILKG